jgi:cellulose synthase/poly-beta-1,6-N-acetylglucosamine synthase-like glycosyltransferase
MDRKRLYRLFEIIPGTLIWITFALALLLSFFWPVAVIYFIIIFDLFWLFRVCYFVFYLSVSWGRYRRAIRTDWFALAKSLPRFGSIYHVVILPFSKEGPEILRATLQSLASAKYPVAEKLIVVLTGEARFPDNLAAVKGQMGEEFAGRFFRLIVTEHPDGLPGEIRGKGSNVNWAGHRAQELVDSLGLGYDDVIVSSFDSDTCAHEQYLACLTYKYLMSPRPTRSSYQPIALYNNNMWDSPSVVRVAAFGTTFWLLTELARPERLFTFASHSMSMRMLIDVGFWQKDIVTEDSRIFLQGLIRYDGDYSVEPIYVPVSMDTVMADSFGKSVVNLYKQQRRWAWGVEHIPYLMDKFIFETPRFPWRRKLYYLWNQIEGMYTWATAPILIFVLGYLPLWLAPAPVKATAFYQNAPHTLEALMTLSMVGVLVSALLSFGLLPPRPVKIRRAKFAFMLLQWALVPFTFILFGSIPAVDAQTRLMLGKYLGFNITDKKRLKVEG